MTARVDVAVVGGGAAGIAAARRLHALQRSVLLLEALPRLGGRARTSRLQGLPLDLGCGWLHSARRNPLAELAEATGYRLDRRESAWHRQFGNLRFPVKEQREAWGAFRRFGERLHADPPTSDRAGDAVPPADRWRPFIDGVSSFINGTELDRLSVRDYLNYEDASTDDNWRLPRGYGAFIASLAGGVPLSLETHVESISCDADIILGTRRGTLRARAAVIAVPTQVLAQGLIRFGAEFADHLQAATRLPLGLADKVYLSLGNPAAIPEESHLLGRFDRAATGSYYLRPLGMPVIECFLGGAWAHTLEEAGPEAAVSFVMDELRQLLGADFARTLAPLTTTRWGREPTILGSYSHALPGHASARAVLASPVSERICFAGEACSVQDFSTAHGAWQSGIEAADRIETFLASG